MFETSLTSRSVAKNVIGNVSALDNTCPAVQPGRPVTLGCTCKLME